MRKLRTVAKKNCKKLWRNRDIVEKALDKHQLSGKFPVKDCIDWELWINGMCLYVVRF